MFEPYLIARLEALLFAAGDPVALDNIAKALSIQEDEVPSLITELSSQYEAACRGIKIRKVGGSYQLVTKPELIDVINQLFDKQEIKLSNAAMETLAIIAFKQPVTRSEMEAIRGVKVDGVVNTLLETGLICEAGRKDVLGRPILYATTEVFLTTFGIESLSQLPEIPHELLSLQEQRDEFVKSIDNDAVISEPLFTEFTEGDKEKDILISSLGSENKNE